MNWEELDIINALLEIYYPLGIRGGVAACTGEPDDGILSQLHDQWAKKRNRYVWPCKTYPQLLIRNRYFLVCFSTKQVCQNNFGLAGWTMSREKNMKHQFNIAFTWLNLLFNSKQIDDFLDLILFFDKEIIYIRPSVFEYRLIRH